MTRKKANLLAAALFVAVISLACGVFMLHKVQIPSPEEQIVSNANAEACVEINWNLNGGSGTAEQIKESNSRDGFPLINEPEARVTISMKLPSQGSNVRTITVGKSDSDTSYNRTFNIVAPYGYHLAGWTRGEYGTLLAPGSDIKEEKKDSWNPNDRRYYERVTYYAQWSLDYYTITLETESDTLEPGENWTDISPSTAAKTKYGVKYSIQGR